MRVMQPLWHLLLINVMWKSTSSSGSEYLIVWEDLGSSLMYAIGCYFKYVIVLYNMLVMVRDIIFLNE